ncbi:hypothetical protein ESY86_12000 [Subsaximicrobium wynnwilliamsii]|uniref:Uncharacterized protein n=1 Tax=Subsaximicrobium wynnwilliamsii TaxID=291179 RepID=A0A5C6ZFB2_9FLAO|nr:DUF6638 family protein [Subsaximicrobium wynnwilliamsii]TXD82961.1 hypothetical protein ESY87_12035 [Subsaximicrobium wynnwilliamsii]TXD88682.1 hypothetical protein ESY86_12000 [Subsaximicrobium wynnwilliamsii]TXE02775.1 hypothetical protein ESY88_11055 [Subsaximicrobium wynnwilliamsii]
MQKLKAAHLYRDELIPISGKLVERYNKCLKKLGLTETKLTNFSIDGIGWSPEIAMEKEESHYLCNGASNPHGIIISPIQQNKPVYMPYHTFDRDMMQLIFKNYADQIRDITRDSAICIDFDQKIDAFYEPLDVLKYHIIHINFHLMDNLYHQQQEQLQLIDTFKQGNNFIDEDLQGKILRSAQAYGDLRHRNLELPALDFSTSSFYTQAFGGVYVLRDFIAPIVIFQDLKWYKEAIKDTVHEVIIFHISQPELMAKLQDHLIISYDLEAIVKTKRYERIKKFMLAQYLKNTAHPIQVILNDSVLFKSYLNKLDLEPRKTVMSVERYLEKMETSNAFKISDIVDVDLFEALHEPHSSLPAKHQDLIWKLLVNVAPKDVLFLYWYDKQLFYKIYEPLDDSLKDWIIEIIKKNI